MTADWSLAPATPDPAPQPHPLDRLLADGLLGEPDDAFAARFARLREALGSHWVVEHAALDLVAIAAWRLRDRLAADRRTNPPDPRSAHLAILASRELARALDTLCRLRDATTPTATRARGKTRTTSPPPPPPPPFPLDRPELPSRVPPEETALPVRPFPPEQALAQIPAPGQTTGDWRDAIRWYPPEPRMKSDYYGPEIPGRPRRRYERLMDPVLKGAVEYDVNFVTAMWRIGYSDRQIYAMCPGLTAEQLAVAIQAEQAGLGGPIPP